MLTLGIGIGLNTAVFTVYGSVALRLLPVKNPESVVRLKAWYDDGFRADEFKDPEYRFVRDNASSFSAVKTCRINPNLIWVLAGSRLDSRP
jgi:putative ABC transport system permease protein